MALLIVFVSDANCGYELIRELFIVYKIIFEQLLKGQFLLYKTPDGDSQIEMKLLKAEM